MSSGGVPPAGDEPWKQAVICGEEVTHFIADIGQSGGKKGYEGIVGKISGIAISLWETRYIVILMGSPLKKGFFIFTFLIPVKS